MVNTLHEQLLARIDEDSDGCEGTSAESIINAARAVVERHRPVEARMPGAVTGWLVCNGCGEAWPDECTDTLAIASALGVETAE